MNAMRRLGFGGGAFAPGVALALSLALAPLGCASTPKYTWVDALPPAETGSGQYVVREGDLLDIRVYNEPTISTRARVRGDGKITVSLIGDVDAVGKTPGALGQEIQARLQTFLNAPSVTVAVDEQQPLSVTVMGEVAHSGIFTLPPNSGVLQALASAGGLGEYADDESIYVVRKSPPQRIRFTYAGLIENKGRAAEFALRNGDLITVE
jgi:polysaccharide export outer membrane protein